MFCFIWEKSQRKCVVHSKKQLSFATLHLSVHKKLKNLMSSLVLIEINKVYDFLWIKSVIFEEIISVVKILVPGRKHL